MRIAIDRIKFTRRQRQLVDIDKLARSIEEVGLLHPVVINKREELIADRGRIAAHLKLGRTEIDATVAVSADDALAALKAERDENSCRFPLSVSEAVEVGLRIEALEKPAADARQKAGGQPSGNLPEGGNGRVTEKAAEAVGMSRRTYEKAKAVVKAAEASDSLPEIKQLAEEMNTSGKVDPTFKRLVSMQKGMVAKEEGQPALPTASPNAAGSDSAVAGVDGTGTAGEPVTTATETGLRDVVRVCKALRQAWTGRSFGPDLTGTLAELGDRVGGHIVLAFMLGLDPAIDVREVQPGVHLIGRF